MANLQDSLKQALLDSGMPPDSPLLDYLDWAGIRTKNSLAVFFTDHDKIDRWINRFETKVTFGTPEKEIHYQEEDRRRGLLASFMAAWSLCKTDFDQLIQSRIPTTASLPSIPATTTTSTSSTDDKVPKSWPKGVYQQLLNTGNTRPFPEKIILGAEKVVVRMWYEQATSKNYQAVGLGEISTNRTFTATGAVNSTAKKGKSDKTWVLDSDNTLIHQEQKDWEPQSMMRILDSLEAIRWAWILIQISSRTPSTPTSTDLSNSPARILSGSQTSKRLGIPFPGTSP